jgi:signal transduction histidine kinase
MSLAPDVMLPPADEFEARQRRAGASRLYLADALAAVFAHELSQPLAATVAFADVAVRRRLRQGATPGSDAVAEFEEIAAQALRAARALGELRRFMARNVREPPSCACDLQALAHSACSMVGDVARACGVGVECEFGAAPVTVLAQAMRLEHALVQLLLNAIEAARRDTGMGGAVRVAALASDDATTTRFCVIDDGPGIAADQVEKIFMPFHTTKVDGLGMGLWIARSIIEAHGGRLWAEGSPQGGIFRVTLPLHADPDAVSAR